MVPWWYRTAWDIWIMWRIGVWYNNRTSPTQSSAITSTFVKLIMFNIFRGIVRVLIQFIGKFRSGALWFWFLLDCNKWWSEARTGFYLTKSDIHSCYHVRLLDMLVCCGQPQVWDTDDTVGLNLPSWDEKKEQNLFHNEMLFWEF